MQEQQESQVRIYTDAGDVSIARNGSIQFRLRRERDAVPVPTVTDEGQEGPAVNITGGSIFLPADTAIEVDETDEAYFLAGAADTVRVSVPKRDEEGNIVRGEYDNVKVSAGLLAEIAQRYCAVYTDTRRVRELAADGKPFWALTFRPDEEFMSVPLRDARFTSNRRPIDNGCGESFVKFPRSWELNVSTPKLDENGNHVTDNDGYWSYEKRVFPAYPLSLTCVTRVAEPSYMHVPTKLVHESKVPATRNVDGEKQPMLDGEGNTFNMMNVAIPYGTKVGDLDLGGGSILATFVSETESNPDMSYVKFAPGQKVTVSIRDEGAPEGAEHPYRGVLVNARALADAVDKANSERRRPQQAPTERRSFSKYRQ